MVESHDLHTVLDTLVKGRNRESTQNVWLYFQMKKMKFKLGLNCFLSLCEYCAIFGALFVEVRGHTQTHGCLHFYGLKDIFLHLERLFSQ